MNTLRHTNVKALILVAALVAVMPLSARAELFGTCTADPNLIVLTETMLTLSTDIGTMADRILVTEDKIGVMADRIVQTEELLASTLQQLNQNGGIALANPGVLLTAPVTGDVVLRGTAPALQLSDNATSYVVYISLTANFTGNQVLPLLVTPQTPLENSWSAERSTSPYVVLPACPGYLSFRTLCDYHCDRNVTTDCMLIDTSGRS